MAEGDVGDAHGRLLRRGRHLELTTLAWNVVGVFILAYAAVVARSVALAGFGLDSLIEIGASTVVLWELADVAEVRRHRALRMIGVAFILLALYLAIQSTVVLAVGFRPHHSPLGIAWTAVTAVVMFALAAGKARTGAELRNPVLQAEGRTRSSTASSRRRCSLAWCSTRWRAGGGPTRWLATFSSTTPCAKRRGP